MIERTNAKLWNHVSKCVCVICLGLENDTIDDEEEDDDNDDDDDAFCAKFMRFIAILFEL